MDKLIQSWELQLQLLDQEIETGTRSLRAFFQTERNTLAKCLQELKSELAKSTV